MKDWFDFRDFVIDGKYLYASSRQFNGLVKLDIDTMKPDYVTGFDTSQTIELHGQVIDTEDKIYFIPSLGSTIDIYDKHNGKVDSIVIYPQDMVWHCLSAYLVKTKIVLLPFSTQDIICYDIETGEITKISDWEDNPGMKFQALGYFMSGSGTVRGERLYAVSHRNEGVMELNVTSMTVTWHHLSDYHLPFSTMADDGEFLWMAALNEAAFIGWNINKDEIHYLKNFPDNYKFNKEIKIPFCNMVDCGDKIFAAGVRSNMCLWIDKGTGKITECKLLNQEKISRYNENDIEEYRLAKKVNEDTILLVSCRDKAIIKYNFKSNTIERKLIEITAEIKAGLLKSNIVSLKKHGNDYVIMESTFRLEEFLYYINHEAEEQVHAPSIITECSTKAAGIGDKIFSHIKESLINP